MLGRLLLGIMAAILVAGCSTPLPNAQPKSSLEHMDDSIEKQLLDLNERVQRLEESHSRLLNFRRSHIDLTSGVPGQIVVVYYWDYLTTDLLQPVEVLIPASVDPLRGAIEALVAGVPDAGLLSGIGSFPELLNVSIDGRTAILEFDEQLEGFEGGTGWATAVLTSLVYTATADPRVSNVMVLTSNRPAVLHGMVWDTPKERSPLVLPQRVGELIRYEGPEHPKESRGEL